jgi:hypothetical protein
MPQDEVVRHAKPHDRRAVSLDHENAEARARLAFLVEGWRSRAVLEAEQALIIDPRCAEVHSLKWVGLGVESRLGTASN